MMVQSSIPSSQLYPPGVAAPAQLGWDTAASPYSSASPCEYDGIEGAAAVLAGKQQTASDHVAVTILRPYTADAAGPQHVDKALISLSLLLDGDRVHAVIKPLQPSPVPSIKANPASTTAARIKSAAWRAAGGDARARDPVQAASTMYDALRSSCGKVRPQCPRPSIARRRWQAAVAAIVFQRHYPAMLRLQDETAMKIELLTASLSGPSSMIEKWLNFDPQSDLHQHADHMACRQAVIAAEPAADPTSRCSLIPAAYAGVQVIDTVAYVHLEMDGSMSGLMASQWLRDLKCMFSVDASGSVTASGSSMSDHNSSGFDESGRTSVQSPIPAGPVINFVKPASLAATAVTTSDGPADGSSSRARTKTASKPRSGWRGILHGVFSRKAHKQSVASQMHPSLGTSQHTPVAPHAPACDSSRADASMTQGPVPAPAPAASSSFTEHLDSGSSSPMVVATVGVAGSVAQVHLELNSMMFDILAGLPGDEGGCTTSANAHAGISGHGTAADGSVPPALPAVLMRSVDANAAAELSSMLATFDSQHGTVAQPVPKTRVMANLAEWEALLEEQQLKRSSRRRRCCRGGPPGTNGSDSSSDDEAVEGFAARAVQEPACEGAVPAAVPLLESERSMICDGMEESSSNSSWHSAAEDCRDGSFIVPEQQEEEEEAELAGPPGKRLQGNLAAGRGLGSWWRGRVSSSFRKAADSIFGPPSSSSKELQVARRADAAARASVVTATTEEGEEHEIEVAGATDGSSGGAGGGVSGAGRVGYLTKLFSIRSRRDVLLAAGDQ